MGLTKVYEAQVDLSAFTTTDDREGDRTEVAVGAPPDQAVVRAALDRFLGETDQTPPNFSAVHVQGRRAYKMARRGEVFKIAAKKVRIDAIELVDYAWPIVRSARHLRQGDLHSQPGSGPGHRPGHRGAFGGFATDDDWVLRRAPHAMTAERLKQPINQGDLLAAPGGEV